MIKENIEQVREKIAAACRRAGRDPKEVTLIAVSKTKPVSDIYEAMEAGIVDFGENKVQELTEKYETIAQPLNWHMIGHLQRNKVKYIVDKVKLIHSVDSLRLAEQISKEAVKKNEVPILFIHGSNDLFVKTEMLEPLFKATSAPKDKLVIDGAGHGEARLRDPETYFEKVFDFIDQYR